MLLHEAVPRFFNPVGGNDFQHVPPRRKWSASPSIAYAPRNRAASDRRLQPFAEIKRAGGAGCRLASGPFLNSLRVSPTPWCVLTGRVPSVEVSSLSRFDIAT